MNILNNENGALIFKIIGALFAFLSLRWIMKVFAADDGNKKINTDELKKVTAFLFFLWAAIYIIVKEANRPLPPGSTEHIFSETWIFFVFSGLLTVLSLEKIIDLFLKIIDSFVKLRTTKIEKQDSTQ